MAQVPPGSWAGTSGDVESLETYWLVMACVVPLGVAIAFMEDVKDRQGQSASGAGSYSPVSHMGGLLEVLEEMGPDGILPYLFGRGTVAEQRKPPEEPRSGLLWSIGVWDHALGKRIYDHAQRDSTIRLVSTLITLSGDEAVWFTLPILGMFGSIVLRLGPDILLGFSVELLGDVFMSCVVEMTLKFMFQRDRPAYAKQATYYVLPGEWWSFPSGHSMRGAFLARRFATSPAMLSYFAGPSPTAASVATVLAAAWALAVAWSRAAKGRHSPIDVVVGLCCGLALAEIYATIGLRSWCIAKLFAGSVTAAAASIMAVRPEFRLEGYREHLIGQGIWYVMQPYGLGLNMGYIDVVMLAVPVILAFTALAASRQLF